MFTRTRKLTLALAALACASAIYGHDAKLHKGTPTQGTISSVAGNNLVVKTAKGDVKVTVNKDTKYEMGEHAVDLTHFKAGDKVSVFGTKLASGELVAKEMVMPDPDAKKTATSTAKTTTAKTTTAKTATAKTTPHTDDHTH